MALTSTQMCGIIPKLLSMWIHTITGFLFVTREGLNNSSVPHHPQAIQHSIHVRDIRYIRTKSCTGSVVYNGHWGYILSYGYRLH